jgi:hypothetical protein
MNRSNGVSVTAVAEVLFLFFALTLPLSPSLLLTPNRVADSLWRVHRKLVRSHQVFLQRQRYQPVRDELKLRADRQSKLAEQERRWLEKQHPVDNHKNTNHTKEKETMEETVDNKTISNHHHQTTSDERVSVVQNDDSKAVDVEEEDDDKQVIGCMPTISSSHIDANYTDVSLSSLFSFLSLSLSRSLSRSHTHS